MALLSVVRYVQVADHTFENIDPERVLIGRRFDTGLSVPAAAPSPK